MGAPDGSCFQYKGNGAAMSHIFLLNNPHFQKEFQNVQDTLVHLNDTRVQTCVIYGVDEKEIKKEVIHMHMLGIDRVVPIGKSLDIDLNWDGYDMIRGLSRKIG